MLNPNTKNFLLYLAIFSFLLCLAAFQVNAKPSANVKSNNERAESTKERVTLILPYAFSTEDMGFNLGVGAMANGLYQKQMSVGGTVFKGADTQGAVIGVWDYQLFNTKRFYISGIGMVGDYPLLRGYTSLPDTYTAPDEARAGSNDSSFDDFFVSKGTSNWWEVKVEYVVPWGNAEHKAMQTFQLNGGIAHTQYEQLADWNPLKTGTTIAFFRQFNRYQLYQQDGQEFDGAVHGFEVGVLYDHTDFHINPTQGSAQSISYSYNPRWLESDVEWRFIEAEASKYFSFGESEYAKQRVLALNMWAGYSPSWSLEYDEQGHYKPVNNPPFLEGATLGGMYRMRGYRQNRFHDKAAIYATAEYRMTLKYNPIEDINWLNFLQLDWFQAVAFVEGGRVSPSTKTSELFSNWKSDIGVSLRALTAGVVIRFDIAKSNEGTNMWIMVGQPF